MKTVLVRYTTRPEKTAENEALVHAVYDELRASPPDGLRYATFKLADGATFVHLAMVDTADGSNPLVNLASFKRFTQAIGERCAEPPVSSELEPVDQFGFAMPDPVR